MSSTNCSVSVNGVTLDLYDSHNCVFKDLRLGSSFDSYEEFEQALQEFQRRTFSVLEFIWLFVFIEYVTFRTYSNSLIWNGSFPCQSLLFHFCLHLLNACYFVSAWSWDECVLRNSRPQISFCFSNKYLEITLKWILKMSSSESLLTTREIDVLVIKRVRD